MRTLLATGPLVALLNQRDFHHEWSVKRAGEMPPPFYTCEAVLTEAHFLLGRAPNGRARLTDMLATGKIELTTLVLENLDRVGKLMHTYSNVPMAFADACLVCMAEQTDGTIFTLDADFRIYRKHGARSLKLVIP